MLSRHLESSAQLPVRLSLLMILLLVLLADKLGLDVLLGAFSAGIVVRRIATGDEADLVRAKLEAIGFGFLIPIFFVVSGITFDLHVFIQHPESAVAGAVLPRPDAPGPWPARLPPLPQGAPAAAVAAAWRSSRPRACP